MKLNFEVSVDVAPEVASQLRKAANRMKLGEVTPQQFQAGLTLLTLAQKIEDKLKITEWEGRFVAPKDEPFRGDLLADVLGEAMQLAGDLKVDFAAANAEFSLTADTVKGEQFFQELSLLIAPRGCTLIYRPSDFEP